MIVVICLAIPFSGQTPSSNNAPSEMRRTADVPLNSWGIVAGTSVANAHVYGASSDRRLTFFAVRYSRVLWNKKALALNYTPEIIPLAVLAQPAVGNILVSAKNPFTHTQIAYAAGVNPVGLELVLVPRKSVEPFIGTTEGFLYFSRNVPSPLAAQFNFAVQVGTGLKVRLGENARVSVGYFFHHLSNSYEAHENPGVDSHMINFSYTFRFPIKSQ
jgi:hypothetical protein